MKDRKKRNEGKEWKDKTRKREGKGRESKKGRLTVWFLWGFRGVKVHILFPVQWEGCSLGIKWSQRFMC